MLLTLALFGVVMDQNNSATNEAASSGPSTTEMAVAPMTEMAGGYKCIDRWRRCTDFWCNANCNHRPRYCPPSYCRGIAAPPPPPAPPPPKPKVIEVCPAGSILGTSFFNEAGENVHAAYKLVCCPAACGDCAGKACGSRPGGSSSCCGQTITKAAKKCGTPPCVLGDPPPATEMAVAPMTEMAGAGEGVYKCIDKYGRCTDNWCDINCNHVGAAFCPKSYCRAIATGEPPSSADGSCKVGIEGNIANAFGGGKVCCPKSCGSCGGKGCSSRPGGASNCCVGNGKTTFISGSGKMCSDGAPPCISIAPTEMAVAPVTEMAGSPYWNSRGNAN
jgi:hypothetical protein